METFIMSVAECMRFAVESFCPEDLPAVIIYDADAQTVLAEPVARYASRKTTKCTRQMRIVCRIDHNFMEAARRFDRTNPVKASVKVIDI